MSIILKNNRQTTDPKLDRLVEFDERSRKFSIGDIREKSQKLRSYTWRCNEWFDQGNDGACVAFSLGHELAARPSEVKGLKNKHLIEDIYWEAQKTDPWVGGAYPDAKPKYEGTSVLSGVKVVKDLGYIEEYRWAFNIDDILYGIGHNGPAILGVYWFRNMHYPDENGFVTPTGGISGGHAVLARAINIKEKYVTIRNSWGKSWGDKGDCYITFDHLEYLMKLQGECCFLMHRKTKLDK